MTNSQIELERDLVITLLSMAITTNFIALSQTANAETRIAKTTETLIGLGIAIHLTNEECDIAVRAAEKNLASLNYNVTFHECKEGAAQ